MTSIAPGLFEDLVHMFSLHFKPHLKIFSSHLIIGFFFFFPSLALLFLHTSLSFLTLKSVEKIIYCFSKFLAGIKSTRKKKITELLKQSVVQATGVEKLKQKPCLFPSFLPLPPPL